MTYEIKRQAGLTLVELMVATTLSLVLLAGVLLVFSANKTTYRMQGGLGTLQENGRYAIRQIASDLQMAGYGGCLSPRVDPRIVILTSSPPPYLQNVIDGEFFDGRNDESGTHTYGGRAMWTGTDSLEIRGPLRSNINYVTGELSGTSTLSVLGTNTGFAANEYLMLSDCAGGVLFRAGSVSTSGGNTQITNSTGGLSRPFGADSVVMEFTTHTYFVADTGRTNTAGQAVTALYRFDGTTSTELVDGVEDLQIEFALDTDGNGVVDGFADPGGVTNWDEVLGVQISLLLNSVEGASAVQAPYTFFPSGSSPITPGSDDYRLRQEFTTMVSIRNSVF